MSNSAAVAQQAIAVATITTPRGTSAAVVRQQSPIATIAAEQGIAGPPGGGSGSSAPIAYAINGVASYTARHGLPFVPRVTILDASGVEVDTDVLHAPGQATVVFATPFTGTLHVG